MIKRRSLYSKRDLNPHSRNGQGILSPSCLPIPPFEHPSERKTRLELATPTLARLCSTNWAISARICTIMKSASSVSDAVAKVYVFLDFTKVAATFFRLADCSAGSGKEGKERMTVGTEWHKNKTSGWQNQYFHRFQLTRLFEKSTKAGYFKNIHAIWLAWLFRLSPQSAYLCSQTILFHSSNNIVSRVKHLCLVSQTILFHRRNTFVWRAKRLFYKIERFVSLHSPPVCTGRHSIGNYCFEG